MIEWLSALLPDYRLPWDSSDEELRELLSDGAVLCHTVNTLIPGVIEVRISRFGKFGFLLSCGDVDVDALNVSIFV